MKKALIRSFLAVFLVTLGISANAQTRLNSLNGGTVDLRGQRGKVVVLAIGASWLPLSSKQAEFTNALVKKYAGKAVVFYFIATDSANPKSKNYASDEKLRQWAAANTLSIEVLRDPDGEAVTRAFTIDQLPAFVILDKEGKQSGDTFGGIDPKFDITVPISKKIDSLL
ncbi:MAG: hypothetical protein C4325_02165 [Blastocatellia bacterium]